MKKPHEDRADELARAFGADAAQCGCTSPGKRGWTSSTLTLWPRPSRLPIPRKPDPAAVVAGRIEAGQPWLIRLRDTHLFIAGATCSGKAALLQAIVRGPANGIRGRQTGRYGGSTQSAAWS